MFSLVQKKAWLENGIYLKVLFVKVNGRLVCLVGCFQAVDNITCIYLFKTS